MSTQSKVPKVLVVDDEPDVELLISARRRIRDGGTVLFLERVSNQNSDGAGRQA